MTYETSWTNSKGETIQARVELHLTETVSLDGWQQEVACCRIGDVEAVCNGITYRGLAIWQAPKRHSSGVMIYGTLGDKMAITAEGKAAIDKMMAEVNSHPAVIEYNRKCAENAIANAEHDKHLRRMARVMRG